MEKISKIKFRAEWTFDPLQYLQIFGHLVKNQSYLLCKKFGCETFIRKISNFPKKNPAITEISEMDDEVPEKFSWWASKAFYSNNNSQKKLLLNVKLFSFSTLIRKISSINNVLVSVFNHEWMVD